MRYISYVLLIVHRPSKLRTKTYAELRKQIDQTDKSRRKSRNIEELSLETVPVPAISAEVVVRKLDGADGTKSFRLEERFAEAMVVAIRLKVWVLKVNPVSIRELLGDVGRARYRRNLLVSLAHHVLEVNDGKEAHREHSGHIKEKEKESEASLGAGNTKVLPNKKVRFDGILNFEPLILKFFLFEVPGNAAKEESEESCFILTVSENFLCPVKSFEGSENHEGRNDLAVASIGHLGEEILPSLLDFLKMNLLFNRELSLNLQNLFRRVFLLVSFHALNFDCVSNDVCYLRDSTGLIGVHFERLDLSFAHGNLVCVVLDGDDIFQVLVVRHRKLDVNDLTVLLLGCAGQTFDDLALSFDRFFEVGP